jgi:hypothetical protein
VLRRFRKALVTSATDTLLYLYMPGSRLPLYLAASRLPRSTRAWHRLAGDQHSDCAILGWQIPSVEKVWPVMIWLFLTIAAALATVPAFAQVPDYDTAHRCTEFAMGNRTVKNECRRDEADARRELERNRISQEVWAACKQQVRAEQSYLLLYGCVLNEAEAKSNRKPTASISVGSVNAPATNAPAANTGARSRAAALVGPPGSITIIRSSETIIAKPSGR